MVNKKILQEDQYSFPYHYIPDIAGNNVYLVKHWNWGIQYLARLKLIEDILEAFRWNTLLDIGCGDGRLINYLANIYEGKEYLGIDCSDRAIKYAQAFNDHIVNANFVTADITKNNDDFIHDTFDVITFIEVLEHIEPNNVPEFLSASIDKLKSNGVCIVTVPSKNLILRTRHYQHFDRESLIGLLEKAGLTVHKCEYIDSSSLLLDLFKKILYNKYFIVNSKYFTKLIFKYYRNHHLSAGKSNGRGIVVVCRKD